MKNLSSKFVLQRFGQLSLACGICLLYSNSLHTESDLAVSPFETQFWKVDSRQEENQEEDQERNELAEVWGIENTSTENSIDTPIDLNLKPNTDDEERNELYDEENHEQEVEEDFESSEQKDDEIEYIPDLDDDDNDEKIDFSEKFLEEENENVSDETLEKENEKQSFDCKTSVNILYPQPPMCDVGSIGEICQPSHLCPQGATPHWCIKETYGPSLGKSASQLEEQRDKQQLDCQISVRILYSQSPVEDIGSVAQACETSLPAPQGATPQWCVTKNSYPSLGRPIPERKQSLFSPSKLLEKASSFATICPIAQPTAEVGTPDSYIQESLSDSNGLHNFKGRITQPILIGSKLIGSKRMKSSPEEIAQLENATGEPAVEPTEIVTPPIEEETQTIQPEEQIPEPTEPITPPSETEPITPPTTETEPITPPTELETPTIEPTPVTPTPPPTTPLEAVPQVSYPPRVALPTPRAAAITAEPEEVTEKKFLINFNNVGIIEYINFISTITRKNFIFDNADLDFNVTIISSEPASIDDIMYALLQELRIHNLSMNEVGNNILIHRNSEAQSPAKIIPETEPINPERTELATRVFTLVNAPSANIAEVVKPLLSSLAVVEAVPDTGHLIITDLTVNLEKIEKLIKLIDTPTTALEIGQYQVQFGKPTDVIQLAQQIVSPIAGDKPLVFVPHPVLNTIYVISTPGILHKVMEILPTIDTSRLTNGRTGAGRLGGGPAPLQGAEGQPILHTEELPREELPGEQAAWSSSLPLGHTESTLFYLYKLQYRRGDEIHTALQGIADSLLLITGAPTDLIATINSIQYLEASNSLIFTGTPASLDKLKQFIAQIDIPLRQVLIELLIVETTVDNALNIGVDWGTRFGGGDTAGAQAFLSANSPLTTALDTATPTGALDPSGLARQAGFHLGVIGREVVIGGTRFNSFGALVSALNTNSKTNLVMNPKILVEENTPAEVFAGVNTRFQTQAIANDQGNIITSNFEFRDIGSTLRVTPTISANNMITLDIDQEVSNIINSNTGTTNSNTTTGGTNTQGVATSGAVTDVGPTTRRSTTRTKIHIPNGYFVILSGIISDSTTRKRTQIPCLGGIPVLGGLFSQKENDKSKRNLLLFIRPIIVEDKEIDHQTKREQDIYKVRNRVKKMWEEEVHETLDLLNLKNTDPITQY